MNLDTTKCMFSSSNCREFSHEKCPGAWDGLGIEVFCECSCHNGTKENSSATTRIGSNTVRASTDNESFKDGKDVKKSIVLSLGERFGRPSPRTEVRKPGDFRS